MDTSSFRHRQSLHEDVVEAASLAIHRDPGADALKPVGSSPVLAYSDRTVSSSTSRAFLPPRSEMFPAPSSNAFFH